MINAHKKIPRQITNHSSLEVRQLFGRQLSPTWHSSPACNQAVIIQRLHELAMPHPLHMRTQLWHLSAPIKENTCGRAEIPPLVA